VLFPSQHDDSRVATCYLLPLLRLVVQASAASGHYMSQSQEDREPLSAGGLSGSGYGAFGGGFSGHIEHLDLNG
jgi:hypothetical protein